LLKERGGRCRFVALPGDLSVLDDLLFVPEGHGSKPLEPRPIDLIDGYGDVRLLKSELGSTQVQCTAPGKFESVLPGVYRMQR
jgi:hypothetical protein